MRPLNEARMRAFEAILPTLGRTMTEESRVLKARRLAMEVADQMMAEELYGGPLAGCSSDAEDAR